MGEQILAPRVESTWIEELSSSVKSRGVVCSARFKGKPAGRTAEAAGIGKKTS